MSKYISANFGVVGGVIKQPTTPMRETYDWLTDIITSFNGIEYRSQMRTKPRISINHSFEFDDTNKYDLFNTVYGALRSRIAIPLWQYAQYVGTPSGTTITCDTTTHPLNLDELALVYSSDSSFVLSDITVVTGTSITIANTALGLTNAWLVPVKAGFIVGDASIESSGHNGNLKLLVRIEDATEITGDTPVQYLSMDTCYDQRLKGSSDVYKSAINAQQYLADFQLGKVSEKAPWLNSKILQGYEIVLKNLAEYNSFINWLHRRAGRYREFWRPSFERDFRIISSGAITTTIDVYKDSYTDWSASRVHIAFQSNAGIWYPRLINSITSLSSTTMRITLSSSLGLNTSDIFRMSYLGLRRLSVDSVSIDWIGSMVSKIQLADLEITP